MKDKDKYDLTSTPNNLSFDQKYQTNEISKIKSMKFNSSSITNEMTLDDTNSLESTKQNSLSLKKNSKLNMHSSKISPSTSEQLKINQTSDKIHEINISSRITLTNTNVISQHVASPQDKVKNYQLNSLPQLSNNDVNLDKVL